MSELERATRDLVDYFKPAVEIKGTSEFMAYLNPIIEKVRAIESALPDSEKCHRNGCDGIPTLTFVSHEITVDTHVKCSVCGLSGEIITTGPDHFVDDEVPQNHIDQAWASWRGETT